MTVGKIVSKVAKSLVVGGALAGIAGWIFLDRRKPEDIPEDDVYNDELIEATTEENETVEETKES